MKKSVVITGLAQGMGREVAKIIAGEGWNVAGFDVDAEGIASLGEELKSIGGEHVLEVVDITDRPRILAFRDRVLEKFGSVNTVLSNVGIGFFGPFEEVDLEKALKCLEINVIGASAIFQAFIPSMREQGHGKLIAMSSLVGQVPLPLRVHLFGEQVCHRGSCPVAALRSGTLRDQGRACRTRSGFHDICREDSRPSTGRVTLQGAGRTLYRKG